MALLDAIDQKTVAVFDVPYIRRNLLVRSANAAVKERSIKLFESALTARLHGVDFGGSAQSSLSPGTSLLVGFGGRTS